MRSFSTGYDRLIAIGDLSWTDYEVVVPITLHGIDPDGYDAPSNSPALGLALRWSGHLDWDGSQPYWGYEGFGALAWQKWNEDQGQSCQSQRQIRLHPYQLAAADSSCGSLSIGVTYMFKARVETGAGGEAIYAFKRWRQSQSEPAGWDLTATDFDNNAPTAGSILLIAHEVDATFGTVVVTPLP